MKSAQRMSLFKYKPTDTGIRLEYLINKILEDISRRSDTGLLSAFNNY